MDISMLRSRALQFKNIFRAISSIQKNDSNPKTNPEVVQIGKGIALLLIALLCAWISKSETANQARTQVLQKEWPPVSIWNGVLKSSGWTKIQSPDLSSILKNHPDPFSAEPMIWESDDHCLLFLTQSPYQPDRSEPELWSCATGHKGVQGKVKWRKIGSGYTGVNLVSQIQLPTVKKATSYIDPREIRY